MSASTYWKDSMSMNQTVMFTKYIFHFLLVRKHHQLLFK